ncbi:aroma-sacti cluster domain-containing protein [Streptomyces fuscichromogenes]|uniref:aroma-sacti cluster domain-containing protein n=1 Tax=Streptomyces fuscichromogenes TaxID=1324013 RepID=UPI00382C46BC
MAAEYDDPARDVLAVLEAAGFTIGALPDEQQEVFRSLTPEEVALLVDIKGRLDEAEPEVQAHGVVAGGALF